MNSSMATLLLALVVVSPSMAAELKDEIVAIEKGSWKAWGSHDVQAYTDSMTEKAVQISASGDVSRGRERIAAAVGSDDCTLKSVDFSDVSVRQLSPETAILTYVATQDVTCNGEKLPPKVFATAIYVRQGGTWRWTHYQETAVE
jgi:uncharacterized protein (TIGR02246 family)